MKPFHIPHIGTIAPLRLPFTINGHPVQQHPDHPDKILVADEKGIPQSVNIYDNWGIASGDTILFVSNEFGLDAIVSGSDEQSCWEEYIDQSKPIYEEELWEAWGCRSAEAYEAALDTGALDDVNLAEGYEQQANPNPETTGIVFYGHHLRTHTFEL